MDPGSTLNVRPTTLPELDSDFVPAALMCRAFDDLVQRSGGGVPLVLGIERANGLLSRFETRAMAAGHPQAPLNAPYIERIVKFLLWQRGGWRVWVGGAPAVADHLTRSYGPGGERAFDATFMGSVYEHPFTVYGCAADEVPPAKESPTPIGRHLDGCRVGFDLGASDRKASAVIDGQVVFSEEVLWNPRPQADPSYHYREVLDSITRAAAHLPRLDAIGGSAAGIYIDNRARVASLFRGVPKDAFEAQIAGMFVRIGRELGVPLEIANDGDVTALAGSMSLEDNPVLGLAFGSSLAAGYVDRAGNITGWLNELAFAPIDYRQGAPVDEWSGDGGCGVQYLSQVGAIRIAERAGMQLTAPALPEKLEQLQERMKAGDDTACRVYKTLGVILGYAVAHYARFYELKHILALGRVTTGEGGDIMVRTANDLLAREFPAIAEGISLNLPDEKARRVGQSIAAASLPALA